MTNFEFISWLITISFGLLLLSYMFRFLILKKEKDSLTKELRRVIFERNYFSGEYYRLNNELRTTEQFDINLSQEDIKSIINMIHPDKQPESRKQRANELFIKLRQLQD